jgi:D-lactate dehydrogenase
MKVAVFSTKDYDRSSLTAANAEHGHKLTFVEARLDGSTVSLALGHPAVCVFVNDVLDQEVLNVLAANGTKLVVTRSSGFAHVDLATAKDRELTVARVPSYSTSAVAEHAVGLLLAANRKLHRAHARVREGNYLLHGLCGFSLDGGTVGLIGTGRTGAAVAKLLSGFGCTVLASDPNPDDDVKALGVEYVELDRLYRECDAISLHCPLSVKTKGLLDAAAFEAMKDGVVLVNTGRAAVVDTDALIAALRAGKVGGLGLDIYEEDDAEFFEDHSDQGVQSDALARLLAIPNVVATAHQGFLTRESLAEVAAETLQNVTDFDKGTWQAGARFR